MRRSNIRSQAGVSLVMVMVAVAITAIVSAGLMNVIGNAMTTQKVVQNRQAALAIQLFALGVLSDPAVCRTSFQGFNVRTGTNNPTRISNGPTNFLENNGFYEQGSIQVQSITFNRTDTRLGFKPLQPAGNPNYYKGSIAVQLRLIGQGVPAASSDMVRLVHLSATLRGFNGVTGAPADEIETCIAIGNEEGQIWKYDTAGQNIYYMGTTAVGGRVGIGTQTPLRDLHVNGDILANAFYYASDARLKTDVTPLTGLEGIEQIRGVNFNWKDSGQASFGVLAQEVERVYPLAVYTDPNTDQKMVNYSSLVAPLIEAVKELHQENKELRGRIEKLEKKNQR